MRLFLVVMDSTGKSRGYGLVEFETDIQAKGACAFLNDTNLKGRLIFVREDREPNLGSIDSIARRGQSQPIKPARGTVENDSTQLFIGNVRTKNYFFQSF